MPRMMALVAAAVLAGCGSDSTTGTSSTATAVSVTGTWSGTLSAQAAGQALSFPAILSLTQSGSQVTGTTSDSPPAKISGTLSGRSLSVVLTAQQTPSDDCYLYPTTIGLDVGDGVLTVQSISGVNCKGDGKGGHRSIDALSNGGGSLRKQ